MVAANRNVRIAICAPSLATTVAENNGLHKRHTHHNEQTCHIGRVASPRRHRCEAENVPQKAQPTAPAPLREVLPSSCVWPFATRARIMVGLLVSVSYYGPLGSVACDEPSALHVVGILYGSQSIRIRFNMPPSTGVLPQSAAHGHTYTYSHRGAPP